MILNIKTFLRKEKLVISVEQLIRKVDGFTITENYYLCIIKTYEVSLDSIDLNLVNVSSVPFQSKTELVNFYNSHVNRYKNEGFK